VLVVAGEDLALDPALLQAAHGPEDLAQGVGIGGDERTAAGDGSQAIEEKVVSF
jgi:hypothetical protein